MIGGGLQCHVRFKHTQVHILSCSANSTDAEGPHCSEEKGTHIYATVYCTWWGQTSVYADFLLDYLLCMHGYAWCVAVCELVQVDRTYTCAVSTLIFAWFDTRLC